MNPIITFNPESKTSTARPRFGGGFSALKQGQAALGESTTKSSLAKRSAKQVDRFLSWVSANRTREILVEDFGGFGFCRTIVDSLRGLVFGTGSLNIPAASERLAREGFSIFTDNILAGVSAAGFGKVADKRLGAYSNKWTDFPTLELFRNTVRNAIPATTTSQQAQEKAFLEGLAQQLTAAQPEKRQACLNILQNCWNNPSADQTELASRFARLLNLKSFDLRVNNETFKLDQLLDDLKLFKEQMTHLPIQNGWRETAQKTLSNTLKVKNWKLGFVGLGMAASFTVPYLINRATKRFFGIDYYTGEIGLKDNQSRTGLPTTPESSMGASQAPLFAQSGVFNRFMATTNTEGKQEKKRSYVKEAWHNGNKLPMLLALLPLPIAAGMFDTVHWRGLKPFSKAWRNALDFSKHAPFTTQQQMAVTFALLITSRLMASRSDNEFRERLVDSALGWVLWILGTPTLKRMIAGHLDKRAGQQILLKDVPIAPGKTRKMLKTSAEIDKLTEYLDNVTPEMLAKAKKQFKWLSHGSLLTSFVLLGIVEPLIAMQWTRYNERKKAQQNATSQATPLPNNNPAYLSQIQASRVG
ncbi:MAG TPA: hypothetical protein V6C99_03320 [Oculatellaceae cyanobacterium]